MILTKAYVMGLGAAISAGIFAAGMTDKALSHVPVYRETRDALLDSLFGPAEEFEFDRPTTPVVQP